MSTAGPKNMKMRHSTHSKLKPFFLPLASGSSGLGASFTFSVSSSEKASVAALAAILAETLVGVSTTFLLTFGVFGAGLGLASVLSSSLSSVATGDDSSADSSATLAGVATAFFCLPADLPLPLDLDLLVPAAFFITLESTLNTSLALMV